MSPVLFWGRESLLCVFTDQFLLLHAGLVCAGLRGPRGGMYV